MFSSTFRFPGPRTIQRVSDVFHTAPLFDLARFGPKVGLGADPTQVYVAGGFNNWSGDATELHRQEDGTFAAKVPMNWGEKHAFKYVVDGGESFSGLS